MILYIDILGVRSFSLLPFLSSPLHPIPSSSCFFSLWLFSLLFQSTGQLSSLPWLTSVDKRHWDRREKIIRKPRSKLFCASKTRLWAQLTWNLHPWIIWVEGEEPSERPPFSQDLLSHQRIAPVISVVASWVGFHLCFLFSAENISTNLLYIKSYVRL